MSEQQQLWDALLSIDGLASSIPSDWLSNLYQEMVATRLEWSAFALTWDGFCNAVCVALSASLERMSAQEWLDVCALGDLYLVHGCLQGDDQAMLLFRERYDKVLWSIVQRFAKAPLMPEELYQELWIRLFVDGENRRSRLASYAAQGPLVGWLRVTAVRACIDYTRAHQHLKQEQVVEKEQLAALPQEVFDVEMTFLKEEYRAHFRKAFEVAIDELSPHDRLLLRYHVVEKLNIDQIGALMQFHRSTAARHLQQARQSLLSATEAELMQRLQISQEEFRSIMYLIQSRWDVSVQRLLAGSGYVAQLSSQ